MAEATDFPAAHSMDTNWFAVDASGHVALFDSNEGGAVPTAISNAGLNNHEQRQNQMIIAALRVRAASDAALAAALPADNETQVWESLAYSFQSKYAARQRQLLGLWSYMCDSQQAAPYVRFADPEDPLRLAELRDQNDELVVDVKLPVEFPSQPMLQPPEHVDSSIWGRYWLSLDGQVFDRDTKAPTTDESDAEWGAQLLAQTRTFAEAVDDLLTDPHFSNEGPFDTLAEYVEIVVGKRRGWERQRQERQANE